MKEFMSNREKSRNISNILGVSLAVGIHLAAALLISFNGLTYIYPPPEESSFVLDFTNDFEQIESVYGKEPVAEEIDRTKPVELVRRSESPIQDMTPNEAPAQEPDNFGDIDTPVPEPEPEKPKVDPRASFPGMSKKPTESGAAHSAETPSKRFSSGQADGNSSNAIESGKPNARLEGRRVDGNLAIPEYKSQESGIVVVTIIVDVYGNVTNAIPGAPGTTVDDKTLWAAARNAAMQTRFSKLDKITSDTPTKQEGTITYIFKLK